MIRVEQVSKLFGKVYAVRNVSVEIAPGESVGLVGESGSGKSTMAKILMGLEKPSQGRVKYEDGYSIADTQIIFQNPYSSFDPRMTLGASIAEALRVGGGLGKDEMRSRVRALLQMVDLPEQMAARFPHEVSGGECQRASIARALSREPNFLICDEVVSSLDLIAQAKALNLSLRLLKQARFSLLFISHDLRVIRHLCDRVIVMKEGEISESAPMSQLFASPQDAYTRQLLYSAGLRDKA